MSEWIRASRNAQGRALWADGACVCGETGHQRRVGLVEVDTKAGRLKPVEYKRGKPKPDPMDEIQLCAQGLCLEEMTGQTVSEGALWYMQTRHRVPVVFSDDLRAQTLATIAAVRELLNSSQNPAAWLRQTLQSLLAGGDLPAGVAGETG